MGQGFIMDNGKKKSLKVYNKLIRRLENRLLKEIAENDGMVEEGSEADKILIQLDILIDEINNIKKEV